MKRRQFLSLGLSLPLWSLGCATTQTKIIPDKKRSGRALMIPGYDVEAAINDRQVSKPLVSYGEQTLITRLDPDSGAIKRAIIPIRGHQICPHPTELYAVFACQSTREMAIIDTLSLALLGTKKIENKRYLGGGHAVFSQNGDYLITAERLKNRPYSHKPENHYGRIVIRDPKTLKELNSCSSHGILPHEILLLNNDQHLAVAHYGTTLPDYQKLESIPYHIEPSITIIELASGKLLHKIAPKNKNYEIRHLAITRNTLTAITNYLKLDSAKEYHLPAPIYRWLPGTGLNATADLNDGAPLMLQRAQSIVASATLNLIVISVTESNQLVFINAQDGSVKKVIHTTDLGIDKPRGLALLSDDSLVAVAGSRRNLAIIDLATHHLQRSFKHEFYDHSHLTYT